MVTFRSLIQLEFDPVFLLELGQPFGAASLDGSGNVPLSQLGNVPPAITDHGFLSGLADDDHLQYALLQGRPSGQSFIGGTLAGDPLSLIGSSDIGGGDVIFYASLGSERVRILSGGGLSLNEQALNPTPVSDKGVIYTKDVLGTTELFFMDDMGSITQLTSMGSTGGGWTDTGGIVQLTTITDFVGIGTTSPDRKLDVLSTSPQFRLTHTDGAVYSDIYTDSSGNLNLTPTGAAFLMTGQLVLFNPNTSSNIIVRNSSNSNLAIMTLLTDNDHARFILRDSSENVAVELNIKPGVGFIFNEQGTDLDFRVEGDTNSNLLFIDASTDRVGIRTATPATPLHVVGDATIDGKLTVTGAIDPTFIRLTSGDTSDVYVEWIDGQTVPVSNADEGRIRYNKLFQRFEKSENGSSFSSLGVANAFVQDGNSFGALATLGTNDAFALALETSGIERARFTSAGDFFVGETVAVAGENWGFNKSVNGQARFAILNPTNGTAAYTNLLIECGTGGPANDLQFTIYADSHTTFPSLAEVKSFDCTNGFRLGTHQGHSLRFVTADIDRATILGTGEFLVGSSSLFSTQLVQFQKNQNAATLADVVNTTSGTIAGAQFTARASAKAGYLFVTSAGFITASGIAANEAVFGADTQINIISSTNDLIRFGINQAEIARFPTAGGFLIGETSAALSEAFGFVKTGNSITRAVIGNYSSGTAVQSGIVAVTGVAAGGPLAQMKVFDVSYITSGNDIAGEAQFQLGGSGGTGLSVRAISVAPIKLLTSDIERVRILSDGTFRIGFADAAFGGFVQIRKDQNTGTYSVVENQTDGGSAYSGHFLKTSTCQLSILCTSPSYTDGSGVRTSRQAWFLGSTDTTNGTVIGSIVAGPLLLLTSDVQRARCLSSDGWIFGAATTLLGSEHISLQRSVAGAEQIFVLNSNTGAASHSQVVLAASNASAANAQMVYFGSSYTPVDLILADMAAFGGTGAGGVLVSSSHVSGPIRFSTGGTASANERVRILSSGEFLINTTSLVGTEKLNVTGDVYISGKLTVVGAIDPTSLTLAGSDQFIAASGVNSLNFRTNSSERARINSSGQLLVGKTIATFVESIAEFERDINDVRSVLAMNPNTGTLARAGVQAFVANANSILMHVASTGFTTSGLMQANYAAIESGIGVTALFFNTLTASPIFFGTNNIERARFLSTGEFLVGKTLSTYGTQSIAEFQSNANNYRSISIFNTTSGTLAQTALNIESSTATASYQVFSAGFTTDGLRQANYVQLGAHGSSAFFINTSNAAPIFFATNNIERARISSIGGFRVGSTDAAFGGFIQGRLDQASETYLTMENQTSTGYSGMYVTNGTGGSTVTGRIQAAGTGVGASGSRSASQVTYAVGGAGATNGMWIGTLVAAPILFGIDDIIRGRFLSTGEFIIGTSTTLVANEMLLVSKAQNAGTIAVLQNTTSGTVAYSGISLLSSNAFTIYITSAGYTPVGLDVADGGHLGVSGDGGLLLRCSAVAATAVIRFATNSTERARILTTGEFLIGATSLVGTEKLRVTGTSLIDFTSTTALQVTQTGGGTPAIIVDTTNSRLGVNITPTSTLHVSGTTNLVGNLQISGTTLFESDRDVAVDLLPNADNSLALGSGARRWSNLFAVTTTIGDLNLKDPNGGEESWTIKEGLDTIYATNNRTGQRYKLSMEEDL